MCFSINNAGRVNAIVRIVVALLLLTANIHTSTELARNVARTVRVASIRQSFCGERKDTTLLFLLATILLFSRPYVDRQHSQPAGSVSEQPEHTANNNVVTKSNNDFYYEWSLVPSSTNSTNGSHWRLILVHGGRMESTNAKAQLL